MPTAGHGFNVAMLALYTVPKAQGIDTTMLPSEMTN